MQWNFVTVDMRYEEALQAVYKLVIKMRLISTSRFAVRSLIQRALRHENIKLLVYFNYNIRETSPTQIEKLFFLKK